MASEMAPTVPEVLDQVEAFLPLLRDPETRFDKFGWDNKEGELRELIRQVYNVHPWPPHTETKPSRFFHSDDQVVMARSAHPHPPVAKRHQVERNAWDELVEALWEAFQIDGRNCANDQCRSESSRVAARVELQVTRVRTCSAASRRNRDNSVALAKVLSSDNVYAIDLLVGRRSKAELRLPAWFSAQSLPEDIAKAVRCELLNPLYTPEMKTLWGILQLAHMAPLTVPFLRKRHLESPDALNPEVFVHNARFCLRRGRDELLKMTPPTNIPIVNSRLDRLLDTSNACFETMMSPPLEHILCFGPACKKPKPHFRDGPWMQAIKRVGDACEEARMLHDFVVAPIGLGFQLAADREPQLSPSCEIKRFVFRDQHLTILMELWSAKRAMRASELNARPGMPPYDTLLNLLKELEEAKPPFVSRPLGPNSGFVIEEPGRNELIEREMIDRPT